MMTEQQVVKLMESSSSKEAWNDNADKVIKACDGEYPSFWVGAIVDIWADGPRARGS